jgi:WhiB family redox-sensing transcriptional regulator
MAVVRGPVRSRSERERKRVSYEDRYGGLLRAMPKWYADAACLRVDPDLFFPEKGETDEEAKAVCGGCDVRAECLAYALERRNLVGVWGATNANERDKRRRRVA